MRSGANPFARLPARSGIELVERASHSIQPLAPAASAFDRPADFAIFTSQVTVERLLADETLGPRLRAAVAAGRVVAVGLATEGALRRHGLPADVVAAGSGEAILERLPRHLDGRHVLLPCAEDAAPELYEAAEATRRKRHARGRLPQGAGPSGSRSGAADRGRIPSPRSA